MSSTQQLLLGEGAGVAAPVYIEDVFSTYLYTGNGSTQTITNGIDLSTKGGMVWIKRRSAADSNWLFDTARGISFSSTKYISSNSTNAEFSASNVMQTESTGFSWGTNSSVSDWNGSGSTYASWTFREQAKFFDIVTYTGTGGTRTINHNLGSAAGCIMIKCTSTTSNWMVWHTSISGQDNLYLNSDAGTSGVAADPISVSGWPSSPSTTTFTVSGTTDSCNTLNETYVAYLFASNAGGFGLTGSDNVISCGSYVGSNNPSYPTPAAGRTVTLGYEPQWVMIKNVTTGSTNWVIMDNMRLFDLSGFGWIFPNSSGAEQTGSDVYVSPTATGFRTYGNNATVDGGTTSETFIYVAIRRGPMKVPTLGTSVFTAETYSGNNTLNREFSVDPVQYSDLSWFISRNYPTVPVSISFVDRLRGALPKLWTGGTSSESTSEASVSFSNKMKAIVIATTGNFSGLNDSGTSFVMYNLKRAPSFFDEVCYTGNGTAGLSVSHNLTVPPEMVIVKRRDSTGDWPVLMRNVDRLGSAGSSYRVNSTASWDTAGAYFSDSSGTFVPATDATSTVFKVSNATAVNASAGTYVAYLFATCAGVSKVGSYTGTATTKQVDCGFTAGSRFVMIKRADSTGDWYVWDSARGIVAGNDPYLLINSTAAEVTGTDYVDTYNAGFELSSTAPAALNANGGTYIFLAIA